jgi:hypothetical protein
MDRVDQFINRSFVFIFNPFRVCSLEGIPYSSILYQNLPKKSIGLVPQVQRTSGDWHGDAIEERLLPATQSLLGRPGALDLAPADSRQYAS